jgi:hypothetical protein
VGLAVGPPEASPAGEASDAVRLAGRLGALATAALEQQRAAYGEKLATLATEHRQQLAAQRRRHEQELAGARALAERQRRDLQARLAEALARNEELVSRVVFAERRAEAALARLRGVEQLVPATVLLAGAPPAA